MNLEYFVWKNMFWMLEGYDERANLTLQFFFFYPLMEPDRARTNFEAEVLRKIENHIVMMTLTKW